MNLSDLWEIRGLVPAKSRAHEANLNAQWKNAVRCVGRSEQGAWWSAPSESGRPVRRLSTLGPNCILIRFVVVAVPGLTFDRVPSHRHSASGKKNDCWRESVYVSMPALSSCSVANRVVWLHTETYGSVRSNQAYLDSRGDSSRFVWKGLETNPVPSSRFCGAFCMPFYTLLVVDFPWCTKSAVLNLFRITWDDLCRLVSKKWSESHNCSPFYGS